MTADEFKQSLADLKLSQGGLARLLKQLGDPAEPTTVLRRVERWAQGVAKVPGEAIALMTLLRRYPEVAQEAAKPAR